MFYSGDEGEDGDDDSTSASPTPSETAVAEEGAGTPQQDPAAAISHTPASLPPPASPPAEHAGQTPPEASQQRERENTDD